MEIHDIKRITRQRHCLAFLAYNTNRRFPFLFVYLSSQSLPAVETHNFEKRYLFMAMISSTPIHCRNFLLHLQARQGYDQPVLLKEPAVENPTSAQINHLHNEYVITRHLSDVPGVRPVLAKEGTESHPVLLLEYIPGRSLSELIQEKSFDLHQKLQLAVKIAEILSRIHAQYVMNKDISSSNILVAEGGAAGEHGGVYLIDFGIATVIRQEEPKDLDFGDTLAKAGLLDESNIEAATAAMEKAGRAEADDDPNPFNNGFENAGIL